MVAEASVGAELVIPIGRDRNSGEPVAWSLATEPAVLISGGAGLGKTFLTKKIMRSYLQSAIRAGRSGGLLVFDPKRLGYREFSPHLMRPAWVSDFELRDVGELWNQQVSPFVWKLYRDRMEYIESLGNPAIDEYRGAGLAPVLFVIEEIQATTCRMNKEDLKLFQADLVGMSALFRGSGIVLLLLSQSLNAEIIPTRVKLNAPAKVVLGYSVPQGDFVAAFGTNPPKGYDFIGGRGHCLGQFGGEVREIVIS